MTASNGRPLAVITGACGGMGVACARVFSRRHRLVLADVGAERLGALAAEIERDGGVVEAQLAGDMAEPATVQEIARVTAARGGLDALVHTAGLSPALAGWKAIVEVNLVSTVRLLDALEPQLKPGAAAVLIASMAGHTFTATPEIAAVFDTAGAPGFAARLEPHRRGMTNAADPRDLAMPAYGATKNAVIRLCEQRAVAWGKKGARIVSISPGLVATPMGRKEAQENAQAAALLRATPAARWGTPLDIAAAAEFLASDQAGFISGCDLRVDGGVTGGLHHGLSLA